MKNKEIAYFRVFHDVSRAILSVLDSKEVLSRIAKKIVPAMNLKAASLRLVNKKTLDLELVASHSLSKGYLEKGHLDADKSIPEVLEGRPVIEFICAMAEIGGIAITNMKFYQGLKTI